MVPKVMAILSQSTYSVVLKAMQGMVITSVAILSQSTYSVVLKAMQGMVITSVAVDH